MFHITIDLACANGEFHHLYMLGQDLNFKWTGICEVGSKHFIF